MGGGIHPIAPCGHDSHAPALDCQCTTMGLAIDAQRQTADNDPTVGSQFRGDAPGHSQSPGGGSAGAHHGDRGFIQDVQGTADMDFRRRIIDLIPELRPAGMTWLEMIVLLIRKTRIGPILSQLGIPVREDF